MKKIVFWYKKWNKELETKFLASLLKINFMTNLLIFLGLYVFLILGSLPGNIQSLGFWNAIFGVAIYSVTILVHALGVSYFVPNIFVILYVISRWSTIQAQILEKELVGVYDERRRKKLNEGSTIASTL
ncbi:MAG: hypothetical protein ACLRSL_03785 [Streptococcus sp.]